MHRAAPMLFSTVMALSVAACSDLEDTGIVNDEDPLTSENGLSSNALTSNGLSSNGLSSNALTSNGLSSNGLSSNALVMNALSNQTATGDTARMFFRYLISCALPAGRSVTYTWTDAQGVKRTEVNPGGLGLAPGWETKGATDTDKKIVSACLGARVNSKGVVVPLSLRGKSFASLAATTSERSSYSFAEGAFWGNLFASSPYLYSCSRSNLNSGSATSQYLSKGRTCTSAGCGLITPVGRCFASELAYKDQACFDKGTLNNDWVSNCTSAMNKYNGSLEEHVIATWLQP
jgi:hypothetical protein